MDDISKQYNILKASVIISNYQGMEFLPQCLHHLTNQTYGNYEIIFVDAGSTDGSAEYVEKEFPQIKLIRCGRIGIGEAINVGILNSTGDIIIFDINTDEYVEQNWLEELINQLERFNYNIITGTTRIIYGTNLIDEAGVNINLFGRAKKLGHNKEINNFDFSKGPVDFVGSPAFHRKLLKHIGLVDEEYFIYGEDMDFCYRAKLAGVDTYCTPLARSYHHVRGTMGKNIKQLEYFLRRAYIRFHIIFSSPLKIILSLFYTCIFLSFASFIGSISGTKQSAIYHEKFIGRLKAIYWNIRYLKKNLIKRKQMNSFNKSCVHRI
jgi:GT2 family glycosyltransferase